MEVIIPRCAGLDVHKRTVVACVQRLETDGRIDQEVRTFGTMTAVLLNLADWWAACGVTQPESAVAANALAVVKQALRVAHGAAEFAKLSGYYLADEVAGNYRAVDTLVAAAEWAALRAEPAEGFWGGCRRVASWVRTRGLHKHPRGPKKPQPPRASGKDRHHYSTYRLLQEENSKC